MDFAVKGNYHGNSDRVFSKSLLVQTNNSTASIEQQEKIKQIIERGTNLMIFSSALWKKNMRELDNFESSVVDWVVIYNKTSGFLLTQVLNRHHENFPFDPGDTQS